VVCVALTMRTNVAIVVAVDAFTTPKSDEATPTAPAARVLYCVTEDIENMLNKRFNVYASRARSTASRWSRRLRATCRHVHRAV
jgi:hypothetical protein